MRILIVDDEPAIRSICERVLEAAGDEVAVAASGEEAAGLLDRDWDVIVSDITMPGKVNGLELLRRAKQAGSMDVIMMTAHAELEFALAALRLGAYDFIPKPFNPGVLEAAVGRCRAKRELSAELARERQLRAELARMQKIKDTFGLFVTPEVADYVMGLPNDAARKGVRRCVTVLFTDVRKFTPFAAHSEPEALVDALNELFAGVIAAIQRQGGIVNKFTGDGILALFGAPVEMAGHEAAAARAALEAMEFVRALAERRRSRGEHPMEIGIGVNTGEVVAGCLGSPQRTEYSVIGHAVNVAARLNGLAGSGQILAGPATVQALREAFRRRSVGPLRLQGVPEPMEAWELLPGPMSSEAGRNR